MLRVTLTLESVKARPAALVVKVRLTDMLAATWARPLLVLAAIVLVTFTLDWLTIERPWTWPLIVRVTVQLDTTLALPRLMLGGAWTVPPPVPTTPAETVLDWPRLILAGRTTVTAKAD
jgi:hypothetical protein